jgi:hypothetical protein
MLLEAKVFCKVSLFYYVRATKKHIGETMENKAEVIRALYKVRDDIISKLEQVAPQLINQFKSVLQLIDDYSQEPKIIIEKGTQAPITKIVVDESISVPIDKALKPVQALKKVFINYPDRIFTPPELRDFLLKLKSEGNLYHQGKNILVTTHTAIRLLKTQGFIEAVVEAGADPKYRLSEKEKGLV